MIVGAGTTAKRVAKGALRRMRSTLPRRPRPTILMYHRVAEESFDPWGLSVSPGAFSEQMAWLAAKRTTLPLIEFARRHREGTLPDDAVAITFDDGYSCVANTAAPVLETHGLPATVFLPVELIERGDPFWWDELEKLVLETDRHEVRLRNETFPLGQKEPADRFWRPGRSPTTPRQVAFERIWKAIRPLTADELRKAMGDIRVQAGPIKSAHESKRPMNTEEIRSTPRHLVRFGSHALSHPSLPKLRSDEKNQEIAESVPRCETLVGEKPEAFAYPYGDFDPECERLVELSGFVCACATLDTSIAANSSAYALPRMQVGNWGYRQLARALKALP
jgi:peptidoglycan/xylan/chitin deacetylase (PgdA/CDA1 family)